jgi:hypothetical protein
MANTRKMQLPIGDVDDHELGLVLSTMLPRGAQFSANEVEYRTMADELALRLQYEHGKIIGAVAGPAMTPELEERITAEIQRLLLAPESAKVCRWTMFSSRPVEGYWRYRDQFQIMPAPPAAPRPNMLIAEHPFVLDFAFENSADFRISQARYLRRASDFMLVLNLLLRQRISSPTNRSRHHWVWAAPGSEIPVMWVGEGYMIPDFRYIVDELPAAADVPALDEIAAETYYDRQAGYSDALTIPAELARLLDAFGSLSGDRRERFLRACFWYHTASTVWDYSQSLHLTSLINAIESLASVGPERSNPEGPTKLFLDFMEKFAPGSPSKTQLNKIYDARGEITHGERLLHFDVGLSFGLDETSARDREIGDNAGLLCRGALINWIWSHSPTVTGPLLAKGLPPFTKPARPGTKSNMIVIVPNEDAAQGLK